jgi:hypothetical protein
LTILASLPPGAERSLKDPYAEKKNPWPSFFIILLFVIFIASLWYWGTLDGIVSSIKMFFIKSSP